MKILRSKWFIGLLSVALVLSLLLVTGKKSVQAEIAIEASKEEVWNILTDIPEIEKWNKVLVPVQGSLTIGSTITYEFYQEPNGKPTIMDAKVKQLIPLQLINQAGGLPGLLTFDHSYILSNEGGATTVRIQEEYRGVMVNFWDPAPVEQAYERLLVSLKKRVLERRF